MKIKSGKISFVSVMPPGYTYSFVPNLYNKPDHLALFGARIVVSFYIVNDHKSRIIGMINFLIENNEAVSLPQRPFGSFEFDKTVSYSHIHLFIDWMIQQLKTMGIKAISIKNYSSIYGQQNTQSIVFALISNGFQVLDSDINHHIPITEHPFEGIIDRQEKKRLKKCRREFFIFQKEPHSRLEEIYDFIAACRKEKNLPVSITLKHLLLSKKSFPDNYILFSVRKEGELTAASVSVIVNPSILYDFMHASPLKFKEYSPIVLLVEGIYRYCQQTQMRFLDLGVSSIQNVPQTSLIRFKENIGSVPTVKITFIKKL